MASYRVVVDDQLALYAVFGVLVLPVEVDGPPTTTYGWQQRVLGAFVSRRATSGRLRQVAEGIGVDDRAVVALMASPAPERLVIADPRVDAVDIARLRVNGANQLAAETIAAARRLGAEIRVGEGNQLGHLAERVRAAGIDLVVWDPLPPT
jgi:hypothetical protein